VLRIHELAGNQPPGSGLTEFTQQRVETTFRAAIQTEPRHTVREDVGHEREHGPPVAWRTGRRTRFSHGISITE